MKLLTSEEMEHIKGLLLRDSEHELWCKLYDMIDELKEIAWRYEELD